MYARFYFQLFQPILLLSFLFFSEGSMANELESWAKSKEWRKLLHYQKNFWGVDTSLLDGPGFFFAKDGKKNPLAELEASIDAMRSENLKVGKRNLHPQCSFPARYLFLKEKLRISFVDQKCPELQDFLKKFRQPQSVSVVFSSAYPSQSSLYVWGILF